MVPGSRRRVLIVTYSFLPLFDISVKRVLKVCKYLPEHGWEPVVLTKDWQHETAPEDGLVFPLFREPERLDDIAGRVPIVHARYRTHRNVLRTMHGWLSSTSTRAPALIRPPVVAARKLLSAFWPLFRPVPDEFIGWSDAAVETGVDLVESMAVDAIVSLCPPPTAHVVASRIAKRTGVPWVAQFDDLFGFMLESHPRNSRALAAYRQRRWMRRAAAVGAITPAMLSYLRRTYGVDGDLVMVGFDPEESPAMTGERRDARRQNERFRIVYTGSIYPGDQRPDLFIDALDQLLSRDLRARDELEVIFVGTRRERELSLQLQDRVAASVCQVRERVQAAESLALQRTADLLLLFNLTNPSTRAGTLSFPAKAFEYLAAMRPILAIPSDPGGWGDELLARTAAGTTADTPGEIADVLARALEDWRRGGGPAYRGRPEVIREYSQLEQIRNLARLLDRSCPRKDSEADERVAGATDAGRQTAMESLPIRPEANAQPVGGRSAGSGRSARLSS